MLKNDLTITNAEVAEAHRIALAQRRNSTLREAHNALLDYLKKPTSTNQIKLADSLEIIAPIVMAAKVDSFKSAAEYNEFLKKVDYLLYVHASYFRKMSKYEMEQLLWSMPFWGNAIRNMRADMYIALSKNIPIYMPNTPNSLYRREKMDGR